MDGIEMLKCWNEVKIGGDGVMGDWGVGMAPFGHVVIPPQAVNKLSVGHRFGFSFLLYHL